MQVVIAGRVDLFLGRFVISNPDIEQIEQEHSHTNRIVPVYPLTSGLTQKSIRRMMFDTVSVLGSKGLRNTFQPVLKILPKVINLANALKQIHFPENFDDLQVARDRLAFDEIFFANWRTSTKTYLAGTHLRAVSTTPGTNSADYQTPFLLS